MFSDENVVPQEGIRTPDPVITNDVLYRLSYCGNVGACTPTIAGFQAI